jgi:cell division protein FtsB
MKNILLLILTLILFASCNSKQTSLELEKMMKKLSEKEKQVTKLQKQIENLEKDKKFTKTIQNSDYYRFVETSGSEINVVEKLKSGKQKLIDQKNFSDTLDISDNLFIYKHTSKITQTSESKFELVLRDFDQVESEYGTDFYVRVMTFFNKKKLPLETENSNTDIHILIQPTELGYENRTFVVSDFYDVKLSSLKRKNNSIELTFEHGKFLRKKEMIIIKPESVKFRN